MQMPFAVVRPAKGQDLALAAPGEHEKPHGRDLKRVFGLLRQERARKPTKLFLGQEPLAALSPVAPYPPDRVGPLGPVAEELRLGQDDREHRRGAVRGDRRRAK